MQSEQLLDLAVDALEELKGKDIVTLDVRGRTSITDFMVIVSGTSDRHVKSLADNVVIRAREAGERALGVEGQDVGEWVLIDLSDVIVHVMLPRTRDFYQLERLWGQTSPVSRESTGASSG